MLSVYELVADNHQTINDPNITLWVNVIIRAILDACRINMSCSGENNKDYWQRSANHFLFSDDESLATICDAINLNIEWVRQIARERIACGRTNIFRTRPFTRSKRRYFVGRQKDKLARKRKKEGL